MWIGLVSVIISMFVPRAYMSWILVSHSISFVLYWLLISLCNLVKCTAFIFTTEITVESRLFKDRNGFHQAFQGAQQDTSFQSCPSPQGRRVRSGFLGIQSAEAQQSLVFWKVKGPWRRGQSWKIVGISTSCSQINFSIDVLYITCIFLSDLFACMIWMSDSDGILIPGLPKRLQLVIFYIVKKCVLRNTRSVIAWDDAFKELWRIYRPDKNPLVKPLGETAGKRFGAEHGNRRWRLNRIAMIEACFQLICPLSTLGGALFAAP